MTARLIQLIRRHPGYFAFATTTLALAVGVNVVVFTIVNALWLRPLPFKDADRLVTITSHFYVGLNTPFLASFEAVAGQVKTDGLFHEPLRPVVRFDQGGRDLETVAVTPQYFSLLGVSIRGRDFSLDDDRGDAEAVAVISHRLWSREFGQRDDVIGSVVAAQPIPLRIIGVAADGFGGARRGERTDVWIPSKLLARVNPLASDRPTLMIFARLRRGETLVGATQRLLHTSTSQLDNRALVLVPLKDVFGTPTSPTAVIREGTALFVVAGLAMLVLLGGCATLSALVMVHYERRRHDQAVKLALGASRARLIRELAGELGLVVGGGTIGAIVIATLGRVIVPAIPLPGGVDVGRLDLSIDWRLVGAAALLTVLALVASAWLPVQRGTRTGLVREFGAGPSTTPPAAWRRLRQGLLALHVCTIIVVLVVAGLFVRAVLRGFGNAPGFDVARTAFVTVRLPTLAPGTGSSVSDQLAMLVEGSARAQEALRSVPGIEAVASGISPIGPDAARLLLSPTSITTASTSSEMLIGRIRGGADFLSALGVPLLSGRGLRDSDNALNPAPSVVTESLARVLWPGESPLGQALSLEGHGASRHVIVGVARDFVFGSLARPAVGAVVVVDRSSMFGLQPKFVVRATRAAALAERTLRDAVPEALWLKVDRGPEVIAADLGRQRLGAYFFSGFGLSALLLGIGGVFGLVAYSVESRRREFGLRLALGATPNHLVGREIVAALFPVSVGASAGLILAALVARVFASLLVGLSAIDPLTYVTVGLVMLTCAALAAFTAAWPLRNVAAAESLKQN